jgi:hypothetical protein
MFWTLEIPFKTGFTVISFPYKNAAAVAVVVVPLL